MPGAKCLISIILATYGSRDQEDHGSKSAPGKYFMRPYLKKKLFTKKGQQSSTSSKNACLSSVRP
jgi:hypothetical protein